MRPAQEILPERIFYLCGEFTTLTLASGDVDFLIILLTLKHKIMNKYKSSVYRRPKMHDIALPGKSYSFPNIFIAENRFTIFMHSFDNEHIPCLVGVFFEKNT